MRKSIEDYRFDSEIKAKYENHKLSPDDRMWERINAHLSWNSSIHTFRQIRYLKIAVVILAASLVGTLIYYEVYTTGKKNQNFELSNEIQPEKKEPGLQEDNLSNQDSSILKESYQYGFTDTSKLSIIPAETNPHINAVGQESTQANNLPVTTAYSGNTPEISHKQETIDKLSLRPGADLNSNEQKDLHNKVFTKNTGGNKKKYGREIYQIREKLHPFPPHIFISEPREPSNIIYSEAVTQPGKVTLGRGFLSNALNTETPLNGYHEHTSNKRFSFTLYISPAYSYRTLAENRAFSIPAYGKSYFNNRDQGNFTYAAGALFTYSIFPKLRIKPGFYYLNYAYNFKTQAGYIIYDQNYSWLYTSAGILNFKAYMADSSLQSALLNSKMRFTYLSIPLSAEYDLTSSVFMNVGIDMSFLISKDLQMQAVNYTGDFDFQMENIQHLRPYNLNMMVGLGVTQEINKHMSIIINPTLRISLTALNKQAPVKAYPYAMGLNAGLRYYF